LIKTYRTIQQWDYWLAQDLGVNLLETEKEYLSHKLVEQYGKHILLIGVPHQYELMKQSTISNQVLLTSIINRHKHKNCIESEYYKLPIIPGSIDLVIVPHTFEFIDNPHQLLIEACRVVKPEGLIIIFGFNPFSFWGLKKWSVKSKNMPWQGSFIYSNKIKNWLKLADFELIKQDMLLFRPPMANYTIFKKLQFLEWVGKKIYAPFGGVYVLTARAKTVPLIPIRLRWKQKVSSALHVPLPGPTVRDYS